VGGVSVVVLWVALATDVGVRVVTQADDVVLRALARLRWDPVVDVASGLAGIGEPGYILAAWVTLLVLLVVRRFQHLLATLAVFLVVPVVNEAAVERLGRMRPGGVEIVGSWDGYSHPSVPVTALGLGLTAMVFTLVPPGRWRVRAAWGLAAAVGLLGASRLVLGVDHPTDVAAAVVLGVALPTVAFRLLTPADAFPVTYRRGVRAHLDVGGRRGEAIGEALSRQLGVRVSGIEPFHLGTSAGSTPLRLTTDARGAPPHLFGKLYASTHMWSDRWYKLGRTVRYGRLEDEHPFSTVRRLVEYEDHMLRVMGAAGLRTPRPYGVVEITPDREYLIVTEFVGGASSVTDCDVTDEVVDDALRAVRTLWDAGLAHRDIKPGNLLVRGDEVLLIDVAFAAIRPTPWRQAVDLANMMLTLALCTSAERVYERALLVFTPEEMGEAFAASRGITIPAQLRSLLRANERDLLGAFRALAPPTPPVAIQRWSVRRAALTVGVLVGTLVTLALLLANLSLAGLL
jgi:tRNA A-37 threonylcarbamoyl transferase component Bud32/membrane-associated phospholipid phosphatase